MTPGDEVAAVVEPRPIDWRRYRIRRCMSVHYCEVCSRHIVNGERYYDGGYGKRAHEKCVDAAARTA